MSCEIQLLSSSLFCCSIVVHWPDFREVRLSHHFILFPPLFLFLHLTKRREANMMSQQEMNFEETRVLFYEVKPSILKEKVEIFFFPQIFPLLIDRREDFSIDSNSKEWKYPPSIQISKSRFISRDFWSTEKTKDHLLLQFQLQL